MAKVCTTMIDVSDLLLEGNCRDAACEDVPGMVACYKRAGCFKPNWPLVVSAKEREIGPTLLVLNGNRRALGLQWLRDNEPAEYERICPKGKIPAIVHKGLTLEEEVDLRIDHSPDEDRVPLNDWSIFLAVRQLVSVGMDTQTEIARKLGITKKGGKNDGEPNRSVVQLRINLARLPKFVQDEYQRFCDDHSASAVRWADLAPLYKFYRKEFVEYPQGDGPEFTARWNKAKTPVVKVDKTDEAKELSPASAINRSQAAASNGLRDALLAATNQGSGNLSTIDAQILEGETALAILAQIHKYLGDSDYAQLLSAAQGHKVETPA